MGVISATVYPQGVYGNVTQKVPRAEMKPVKEVTNDKYVPIKRFSDLHGPRLDSVTLEPLLSLIHPVTLPAVLNLTHLWHIVGFPSDCQRPQPNWSGFMQSVCNGSNPGSAAIDMLTIIDQNPSDDDCIYSTLLFVIDQAKALRLPCATITFDQPLFIKAVDIARAAKLNIVIRLGGLHLLMSFLGSIGQLMKGSGLEEVLNEIYGDTTIEHVLSGKAYARALRGHLLVCAALYDMLLQ